MVGRQTGHSSRRENADLYTASLPSLSEICRGRTALIPETILSVPSVLLQARA